MKVLIEFMWSGILGASSPSCQKHLELVTPEPTGCPNAAVGSCAWRDGEIPHFWQENPKPAASPVLFLSFLEQQQFQGAEGRAMNRRGLQEGLLQGSMPETTPGLFLLLFSCSISGVILQRDTFHPWFLNVALQRQHWRSSRFLQQKVQVVLVFLKCTNVGPSSIQEIQGFVVYSHLGMLLVSSKMLSSGLIHGFAFTSETKITSEVQI